MVNNLAPGCRFNPKDCDVIKYLQCKAKDEILPCAAGRCISEADLYGQKEPWEIFQDFGVRKSRYFFTRLKKKNESDRKMTRKLGLSGGTWNADTKGIKIYSDCSVNPKREIGMRKSFSYSNNKLHEEVGCGLNFRWLMTEYTLSGDSLKDPNLKHFDYAVCLIRKMKLNKPKATDQHDDEDDSDDDDGQEVIAKFKDQEFVKPNIVTKDGVVLGKKRKVMTNAMIITSTREECRVPQLALDQQPLKGNRLWDYPIERGDDGMVLKDTRLKNTKLRSVQAQESSQPLISKIQDENFEQGIEENSNVDYAQASDFGERFARELVSVDGATKIMEQAQSEEDLLVPNPFYVNNWAIDYCGNYPSRN